MDYQSSIGGNGLLKWPYPVDYDKVNRISVDVLVIGGGHAGTSAGMAAARRGAKVAVCDKAPIRRSGCGGAGQDHWNSVFENPNSPFTTEAIIERTMATGKVHSLAHRDYIAMKGTYDMLLELERLGMPIRDEDGDFLDARTRDEKTKLLKSYNYEQMVSIKLVGGHYIKPVLYEGLRKAGADLYERIMITSLLTENGKAGERIAGAVGFSMETGEFYIFRAKTVILASGYVFGCWTFSTDLFGGGWGQDPNETGDGLAMAWRAGAKVYGMERGAKGGGMSPFSWPRFASGSSTNTWFPCSVVDNRDRPVPWENADGERLTTLEQRNAPAKGQLYMGISSSDRMPGIDTPDIIPDIGARIKNGEYTMPLWADLEDMPDEERRSIFGVMIGNEGKTRYPVFDYFTRWGFDPTQDMLMGNICEPADKRGGHGWPTSVHPEAGVLFNESRAAGDVAVDWNMMSSIRGLFAAGVSAGLEGCSFACSSGYYAGNRAAELASDLDYAELSESQIEEERRRVYAPVRRCGSPAAYVSWKELWSGSARVMQQCCGFYRTPDIMKVGLEWLGSIRRYEMQLTYARTPHELARVLECESRITNSEVFLKAGIAQFENPEFQDRSRYIFLENADGKVSVTSKENEFWLKAPYADNYLENYHHMRKREKEILFGREAENVSKP